MRNAQLYNMYNEYRLLRHCTAFPSVIISHLWDIAYSRNECREVAFGLKSTPLDSIHVSVCSGRF